MSALSGIYVSKTVVGGLEGGVDTEVIKVTYTVPRDS